MLNQYHFKSSFSIVRSLCEYLCMSTTFSEEIWMKRKTIELKWTAVNKQQSNWELHYIITASKLQIHSGKFFDFEKLRIYMNINRHTTHNHTYIREMLSTTHNWAPHDKCNYKTQSVIKWKLFSFGWSCPSDLMYSAAHFRSLPLLCFALL